MATRVRFFAPEDEAETSSFVDLCNGIDDFWRRFMRVSSDPPTRWIGDLRAVLARVHEDLGLETRALPDGTRMLAIVPLGGPACWPLSRLFLERAPMCFPWSFTCEREPLPLGRCIAGVREEFGIDLGDARARVGVTRGHLLEVVIASSRFDVHDPASREAAEQLCAQLLGDRRFDSWIARVSVQARAKSRLLRVVGDGEVPELPLGLDEVAAAIDAATTAILNGLPDEPLHTYCERAEWTLFELDEQLPGRAPSLEATGAHPAGASLSDTPSQSDLLLAASCCPEALKCLLSGQPFASERFSRHGERFSYLKFRVEAAADEARCQKRSEIEDALDRALVPGRLGCVVGNGLGQEHLYIDLALANVEAAIPVVRNRLERAGVEGDAWMFFFDDEWSNEWLAMNDRTRQPRYR